MKKIVFLLFPDIQELDLAGPIEVFQAANFFLESSKRYVIEIHSTTPSKKIKGACGLEIHAQNYFKTLKNKASTLVVPGGPDPLHKKNKPGIEWIKRNSKKFDRICSICTGAFYLAQADLLNERKATTHWMWLDRLSSNFPQINLDRESIWVEDRGIFTSAGVSTGIDLAMAIIEKDHGRKIAHHVAQGLVLYLKRPGSQGQFSTLLGQQMTVSDTFEKLLLWLHDNIRNTPSVKEMSDQAGMSERNFTRKFKTQFNKSPAEYVRFLQIESIKKELENSNRSWKEITSTYRVQHEALRRSFERQLGITPQQYRKHFGK